MTVTLEAFRAFVADLKGAPLRTIGDGKSFTVFPANDCVRFVLESKSEKPLSPLIFQKCADIFNRTGSYVTTDYQGVTGLSSYILGVFRAMRGDFISNAPVVILKWKEVNATDVLPLDWFKDDIALIGVTHPMRTPRGRVMGEAQCDVTKDGLHAVLDYRPAAYRKFNDQNDVEPGIARLTFVDPDRIHLLKFAWQAEGETDFIDGGEVGISYKLLPAPPYLPPTQPASKVEQLVRPRPGQKLFRMSLGLAYDEKCCVTRCPVGTVLEAAHIDGYLAPESNNVSNGLLLRSDIHVLFDANLLAIEPGTHRIHIGPSAKTDDAYAVWHGREIALPTESTHRPNLDALKRRWEKFKPAHC